MSKWIHGCINDVTSYQKAGGTPSVSNPDFYDGDIPFVLIEDITNSCRFLKKTEKTLTLAGVNNSSAWLVPDEHILYSMYATVGKPVINKIHCATNQAIIALKVNDKVHNDYLYYWLKYIESSIWKYTTQTTQANLNARIVRYLPVFYPEDKSEQKTISQMLSVVDDVIEQTQCLINKYYKIKAGLMHNLFSRGLGEDGKLRAPREHSPELYQETPWGWFPKDWQLKTVKDVFNIDSGITLGSHRRPKKNARPYLRVANVFKEKISLKDVSLLETTDNEAFRYALKKYDLLVVEGHANIQQIGRCAIVDNNAEGLLFQNHLFRLQAKTISPYYGMYYLNSAIARKYWEMNCSTSSGLNTINRTMLGNMPFFVPANKDEQASIEEKLNGISLFLKNEIDVLAKLQAQKIGLMNDLLTGKVPVQSKDTEASHV